MEPGTEWRFFDDPAAFLEVAGAELSAEPVLGTVITSVTDRVIHRGPDVETRFPRWWAALVDGGRVCGVAMRTAPFAPHPLYVLGLPDGAAAALARLLHKRGEEVLGVNGALPAATDLAAESARLLGGRAEVAEHTRLFDLPELLAPVPVPGRLRLATADDLEVVTAWFAAFRADADEQAGRAHDPERDDSQDLAEVAARVADGVVGLWETDDAGVVHLTAWNPPSYGVARIGPVYTPREHRGHGYASAAVAEASRRLLAAGARPCLFTDQANPTSNKIYEAIGYRRVVDTAHVVVRPG